jgi:DNA-binding MarR family transcriptional regulator
MGHDVAMAERAPAPVTPRRESQTSARTRPEAAGGKPAGPREDLVDALLSASRVMVSLAARSLADLDADVTLPQYRALVVLASRGPQRVVDISTELGVNSSTGTRMCDRLVRKELVRRGRSDTDRREVRLTLTPTGEYLVQEVTRRRRTELARIVDTMPEAWQEPVTTALRSLAVTAGEPPDSEWWLGWHQNDASAGPR